MDVGYGDPQKNKQSLLIALNETPLIVPLLAWSLARFEQG
jgi:hypothetical protein